MYDLIIRGGDVIDGTGAPAKKCDVAIAGDRILAVAARVDRDAKEVVEASGRIVTPGFIDVHTHYDGQVTWDDALAPSAAHGVTTVVMGNCGVGFAPVRPDARHWLVGLMEGVEDIPGTALHEGIRWSWETFPEYLDSLERGRYALDIAAQLPHGALRAYVMGDRGASDEPATDAEVSEMAKLVREAIEAGAVGFTCSRINGHRAIDGRPVPGTNVAADEYLVLGRAMRDGGGGVFELVPSARSKRTVTYTDERSVAEELGWLRRFVDETGQAATFTTLENHLAPETLDQLLDALGGVLETGAPLHPQIAARPVGFLTGLAGYHALMRRPSYLAIASLPLAERAARMRDPKVRRAILTEADAPPAGPGMAENFHLIMQALLPGTYPLGDPPSYEPDPSTSLGARAAAEGRSAEEPLYDVLSRGDGREMMTSFVTNYVAGDLRVTERLLRTPQTVLGLGDAGAHVRVVCDASNPTFTLAHWARDRVRGPRLPLEYLVKKLASEPAELYGFRDRGTIEIGKRADLNVIDFAQLRLGLPYAVHDLPGGAMRLLQDARGYDKTIVGGIVVRSHDRDTGARPGRLVRNTRAEDDHRGL